MFLPTSRSAVTIAECKRAEQAVEPNPGQIFFPRLYAPLRPFYQYAKAQIDAGKNWNALYGAGPLPDPGACRGLHPLCGDKRRHLIDMANHDISTLCVGSSATTLLRFTLRAPISSIRNSAHAAMWKRHGLFQIQNGAVGTIHAGTHRATAIILKLRSSARKGISVSARSLPKILPSCITGTAF